jgi:hypothetical protein
MLKKRMKLELGLERGHGGWPNGALPEGNPNWDGRFYGKTVLDKTLTIWVCTYLPHSGEDVEHIDF